MQSYQVCCKEAAIYFPNVNVQRIDYFEGQYIVGIFLDAR